MVNNMTKSHKQFIIDKIKYLNTCNISIVEADSLLTDTLIRTMPDEIKQEYDKMISNKIPF